MYIFNVWILHTLTENLHIFLLYRICIAPTLFSTEIIGGSCSWGLQSKYLIPCSPASLADGPCQAWFPLLWNDSFEDFSLVSWLHVSLWKQWTRELPLREKNANANKNGHQNVLNEILGNGSSNILFGQPLLAASMLHKLLIC